MRCSQSAGPIFKRSGELALQELEKKDLVYLHAQVPSDVAQDSDPKAKLKIVEEFDRKIVGTVVEGLAAMGAYRLLLVCDRPMASGTPPGAASSIPYAMTEGPSRKEKAGARGFSEPDADAAKSGGRDVTKLIARLLSRG